LMLALLLRLPVLHALQSTATRCNSLQHNGRMANGDDSVLMGRSGESAIRETKIEISIQ